MKYCLLIYWRVVTTALLCQFLPYSKVSSCMYTYIPSILDFLPTQVIVEHEAEFPVPHSRFSLVIYFTHGMVYMSIPIFQFIPPLLSLLASIYFFHYVCVSISTLQIRSSLPFTRFHIYALIYNIFFFLTYLTLFESLGPSTSLKMTQFPFMAEYYSTFSLGIPLLMDIQAVSMSQLL